MLYPGDRFRMADDLLETYIRQLLESQPGPEVSVAWQGGEPTLMGLDSSAGRWRSSQKYRRPGIRIEHTIQTNGTELTDEWCEFFREHGFLVGLSLDGPREMHDLYRVDKGGRPTFDKVMAAARLMQKHGVEFNILTTVHAGNADHPLEVYRFLRDEVGTKFIQFIPIIERVTAELLTIANSGWGARGSDPRPLYLRKATSSPTGACSRSMGPVPGRRFSTSGYTRRRHGVRADVRRRAGVLGRRAGRHVHLRRNLRQRRCARAQRRPLLVRPLRRAEAPARQHPQGAHARARRLGAAAGVRRRKARHAAALLPRAATCGSPATASARRTASSRHPMASPGSTTCAPGTRRSSRTSIVRCG